MRKLLATEKEVIEALGISRTSLWKARMAGELVPVRIRQRGIRYKMSDVEAFIERFREVTNAEVA